MPSTRMLRMVNLLTRGGITGAQFQTFASIPGVAGEMERLKKHTSLFNRLFLSDAIMPVLNSSSLLRTYLFSDEALVARVFTSYSRFSTFVSTTEGEDALFNTPLIFVQLCKNPAWVSAYFGSNLALRVRLYGSNYALSALQSRPESLPAFRGLPGFSVRTFNMATGTTAQAFAMPPNSRNGILLGMTVGGAYTGNMEIQPGYYRADYNGRVIIPGTEISTGTTGDSGNMAIPLDNSTTNIQLRHSTSGSRAWYFGILSTTSTSST